jgi:hypothetical protein
VAYLDLGWPAIKWGVECDSLAFHSGKKAHESDRARRRRLKQLGWDLVEVTYDDITKQPVETGRQLRALHRQRATQFHQLSLISRTLPGDQRQNGFFTVALAWAASRSGTAGAPAQRRTGQVEEAQPSARGGNDPTDVGVIPLEAALLPRSRCRVPASEPGWSTETRCPVTEIVLISLAVVAVAIVIGGLVGRLGDLDDLGTMRDMVDRS